MIGGIEVIKNMYDGINLYRKNFPDESRQILDPLTTMIKLAILGYKPIGTKLAIDNNKIYFQEPTFSQGLLRWVYGNKRYELHQLLHPIGKAVKRYDIKDNSILIIFQLAVKGLNQLKLSYKNNSSLVIHSLELYISIINSVLIIDNDDNRSKSNMILNTISEEDDKIDFTKQEWIEMCKLKNMKMSFGCVLFREKDILDINDFIDYGDMSFWLSSLSDRIFELEQEDWHK